MNPLSAPCLETMRAKHLDSVVDMEHQAHDHPWPREHFVDCFRFEHYFAQVLTDGVGIWGYVIAMEGADEIHLLNLVLAPEHRGQGHARAMLDAVAQWTLQSGLQRIWLEVRASNDHALRLYEAYGFQRVGRRPRYYPCLDGRHEDAVLMTMVLDHDAAFR